MVRLQDWLTRRVTAGEMDDATEAGLFSTPMRRRFRARVQPGDEVWRFQVPAHQNRDGKAAKGIAILRGGEIAACLIRKTGAGRRLYRQP